MKKLEISQMENLQGKGFQLDCSDAGGWKIVGAGTAITLMTGGWGFVAAYSVLGAWIIACGK